jgi:predicted small secreted protein
MMKKLFAIFSVTGLLMTAAACNTVRGAADDVESTTDCVDGKDNNC